MNTLSTETDRAKFADGVIAEFGPIVGKFGFGGPQWDYDPDLEILRVQFENSSREEAVQIDYSVDNDSYAANFCRNDAEWQICAEGKLTNLQKLKDSVAEWILENCEDCCVDCEPREEPEPIFRR